MRITSVLTESVLPSIEDLNSDRAIRDVCAIASPAFSHRPHKSFRDDLVWHPEWAAAISLGVKHGYDAPPVAFRTFRHATLLGRYGVVVDEEGACVEETTQAQRVKDPDLVALEGVRHAVRPALSVSETCLFAGHGTYCVYGHFVLEIMLSVYALQPLVSSGAVKIIMPLVRRNWFQWLLEVAGMPASNKKNWPHRLLGAMDVSRDSRIDLYRANVFFDRLIVGNTCSGHLTFNPNPLAREFAASICQKAQVAGAGLRLFLTRTGTSTTSGRTIRNEAALSAALQALNFVAIDSAKLSFMEQVSLFKSAEMVIGLHGSAFTNVIFARAGCMVCEILPDYWAEIGGNWIGNLTNLFELDYFYILAKSTRTKNRGYVVDVDVDLVVSRVRRALASLRLSKT